MGFLALFGEAEIVTEQAAHVLLIRVIVGTVKDRYEPDVILCKENDFLNTFQ